MRNGKRRRQSGASVRKVATCGDLLSVGLRDLARVCKREGCPQVGDGKIFFGVFSRVFSSFGVWPPSEKCRTQDSKWFWDTCPKNPGVSGWLAKVGQLQNLVFVPKR